MITNSSLTIYHKSLDTSTKLEKWTRYNYSKVWFFGNQSASMNNGYDKANSVQVRIPIGEESNIDIANFSIGDIVVQGTLTTDIETQQDLSNYRIYNITSISYNNFGNNPHIHLGGS